MDAIGSCNRKRKACEQDDEEDDEEKMEKFFALIRSIKEARDILMGGGGTSNGVLMEKVRDDERKKSKREEEEEDEKKKKQPVAVWVPAFEREDFMGESDRLMIVRNSPGAAMAASVDKKGAEQKEGVGDEGLDLKLSL